MRCSACGHEVSAEKEKCMYCGAHLEGVVKADEGAEAEANAADSSSASIEDVPWQFTLEKRRRRKPLSLVTKTIIFFAAFAIMGVIVLLLS